MQKRKIIKIDADKCNGCGLCADACHEGAIVMVNGKAQLLRDDYCDGLGDCLPVCEAGAIEFVVRDALAYDHEAVQENIRRKNGQTAAQEPKFSGCPGSRAHAMNRQAPPQESAAQSAQSQLMQWPVQLKLVPVNASFFDNANLLIAADCAAYAYSRFHTDFMQGKVTVIGCPKLDNVDYTEKLAAIISQNQIKSVTAVRMQVPCCGGIENAVKAALMQSGKFIPWQVYTLTTDGQILK